MKHLLLVLSFLLALSSFAQPTIAWQKNFGGSEADWGRSVVVTPDGGFVAAGNSMSDDADPGGNNGSNDYYVIKTSSDGTLEWETSLGGSYSDQCFSVINTTDGGYAVAGSSMSNNYDVSGNHNNGGVSDFWIVKLHADGTVDWSRCYGGTSYDNGRCIIQTADGGYAICGDISSGDGDVSGTIGSPDMWLLKIFANGDVDWQKVLGGSGGEIGYSVAQADDGGYVVVGETASVNTGMITDFHGGVDFWVVKLDATGELVWQKCYGGTAGEIPYSIVKAANGDFAIAGLTSSTDGDATGFQGVYDYWVIRINDDGDLLWQKSLGGYSEDKAYSIDNTLDGGFVVVGSAMDGDGDITGNHGSRDMWLVKLSSAGELEWQRSIGGNGDDYGYSARQINTTDYIVTGQLLSSDGDATGTNGWEDLWLVRLSLDDAVENISASSMSVSFSPNPISSQTVCTIKGESTLLQNAMLQLTDAQGKIVLQQNISSRSFTIERAALASGVYFYSVQSRDHALLAKGKVVME